MPPVDGAPIRKKSTGRSRTSSGLLNFVRRLIQRLVLLTILVILTPFALTLAYAVATPVSTLMIARLVTLKGYDRSYLSLEQIDADLVRSVIASEDARFCLHKGVDWTAVQEVIEDFRAGNRVRGASTITMQTVKNLFLWPQRSYIRKGLEVPLALYLDAVLGKRRVLEIYLNIAEWGPDGHFGIEAGSQRALNQSAADLSANQAALMTVMLPNPKTRDAARPSARLQSLAGTVQARAKSQALETGCIFKN